MAEKLREQQLKPQATVQTLQLALESQAPQQRLARSLEEFGKNITGTAVEQHNKDAEKQRQKGRVAGALAVAEGRATEEELVADGIITRGEGSFFRDGVMNMAGQAHADAFSAALLIEASRQSLHTSVDPEAMDKLVESMSEQFSGEGNGEAFAAGFANRASQLVSGHLARHAITVAGNLEQLNNDQLVDGLRGVALEATDATDAEFIVDNVVTALVAKGAEWRANNTDENGDDLRLLNKSTTAVIAGLVRDGIMNEDQAIETMERISGGTGSLWSMQKHADVVQKAINVFIGSESARFKWAADNRLREQMAGEEDYLNRMYANYLEDGFMDTTEIQQKQILDPGFFQQNFLERVERFKIVSDGARQQTWAGDEALFNEYRGKILRGETLNLLDIVDSHVKQGELNMPQAVRLYQMQASHKDAIANDPIYNAEFNRLDGMTRNALTAWAGADFATQQYQSALATMSDRLNTWRADPKNAGLTATSPEFLAFAKETTNELQRMFMMPAQWRTMQETQADNERDNRVQPYFAKSFESNPAVLKEWYAETLLLQQGRPVSDGLADFMSTPGHALLGDDTPENFTQAILGQLKLAGVDVANLETAAEIDDILLRMKPVADEEDEDVAVADETKEQGLQLNNEEFQRLYDRNVRNVKGAAGAAVGLVTGTAKAGLDIIGWAMGLDPEAPALDAQGIIDEQQARVKSVKRFIPDLLIGIGLLRAPELQQTRPNPADSVLIGQVQALFIAEADEEDASSEAVPPKP